MLLRRRSCREPINSKTHSSALPTRLTARFLVQSTVNAITTTTTTLSVLLLNLGRTELLRRLIYAVTLTFEFGTLGFLSFEKQPEANFLSLHGLQCFCELCVAFGHNSSLRTELRNKLISSALAVPRKSVNAPLQKHCIFPRELLHHLALLLVQLLECADALSEPRYRLLPARKLIVQCLVICGKDAVLHLARVPAVFPARGRAAAAAERTLGPPHSVAHVNLGKQLFGVGEYVVD